MEMFEVTLWKSKPCADDSLYLLGGVETALEKTSITADCSGDF